MKTIKMKQIIKAITTLALLALVVPGTAFASQNIYWNNFSTSGNPKNFNTAGNWLPATVPGVDDVMWLTNFPASYALSWSALVTNRKGVFDLIDQSMQINLMNADWNLSESLTIGNRSSGTVSCFISGGHITITNSAGTGTLKVNWGTEGAGKIQYRGHSLIADHIYSSNSFTSVGLNVIDTGIVTTLGDSIFAKGSASPGFFYIGNLRGANARWDILGGTNIVEQNLVLAATGVYGGGNVGRGTGEVCVAGNNATFWAQGGMTVGGNSEGVGYLTVTNGGTAHIDGSVHFANNAGNGHAIRVSGSNSLLVTTGQIYMYTNYSNNMIRVENGGRWRSESASGSGQMYFNGGFAPNVGIVVDGPGSVFEGWRDILLGGVSWSIHGRGTIRVQNGGVMTTPNWAPIYVGGGSGNSRGDLTVTGPGSALVFGSPFYVGTVGTGMVVIADGGLLQCGTLSIGPVGKGAVTNHGGVLQFASASPSITLEEPGTLVITNGVVSFRDVTNADIQSHVTGSDLTKAVFQGHNAFRLNNASTASSGQDYTFDKTATPTTYARLEMVDGNTRYRGIVTIGTGGSLMLSNTEATFDKAVTNDGRLEGNGTLVGSVTSTSGSCVAPDGTLTFAGAVDLQPGTTLELNINGTAEGAFGALAVAAGGTLDIDGVTLTVELGYAPEIGDRFLVIDKGAGTLTGRFSNYRTEVTYNGRNYNLGVQQDPEGIALVSMPLSTMLIVR